MLSGCPVGFYLELQLVIISQLAPVEMGIGLWNIWARTAKGQMPLLYPWYGRSIELT